MNKLKLVFSGVVTIALVMAGVYGQSKSLNVVNRTVWYSIFPQEECDLLIIGATLTETPDVLFTAFSTTHEYGDCWTLKTIYEIEN